MADWLAPFTGSFECVIPKDTILLADYDQQDNTIGFSLIPEAYKKMEKILFPEADRTSIKYGGYYFHFIQDDIGVRLKKL